VEEDIPPEYGEFDMGVSGIDDQIHITKIVKCRKNKGLFFLILLILPKNEIIFAPAFPWKAVPPRETPLDILVP
jgi:hypothetical protein